MLSRAADSLYWMARNVERAEGSARIIDENLVSMLENFDPESGADPHNWQEILRIHGAEDLFFQHYDHCDSQNTIDFLAFSSDNANSILNCIELARENARTIRGMIPQDLWELINSFYWRIKKYPVDTWEMENISSFFQMVKDQSLHFQGIVNAVMSRGDAYTFMQLGKYMERAEKTIRILDIYYHKERNARFNKEIVEHHLWSSVLHSVSGYEAYLDKYKSFLEHEQVMEFLIFNESFPRSIRFSVDQLAAAFEDLEQGKVQHYNQDLFMALGKLQARLKYGRIEEVTGNQSRAFFQSLQQGCYEVGSLISKTYYLGEMDGS